MGFRQNIRCSLTFGHFYYWRHGHGDRCPWCRAARRWPWTRRFIPYVLDQHGRFRS